MPASVRLAQAGQVLDVFGDFESPDRGHMIVFDFVTTALAGLGVASSHAMTQAWPLGPCWSRCMGIGFECLDGRGGIVSDAGSATFAAELGPSTLPPLTSRAQPHWAALMLLLPLKGWFKARVGKTAYVVSLSHCHLPPLFEWSGLLEGRVGKTAYVVSLSLFHCNPCVCGVFAARAASTVQ